MTTKHLLEISEVKDFINTFAQHCGAPKSVFVGQLTVALKAIEAEMKERCATIADKQMLLWAEKADGIAGEYASEDIATAIRNLP